MGGCSSWPPFESLTGIGVGEVTWSASGGTIGEDGLFKVAEDGAGGLYTVKATVEGMEAIAEVRISKPQKPDDDDDDDPKPPGSKAIRWNGEVPPQKWMNFYTKVLSRFASSPGLKLQVSFEVAAEGDQGQSKADEARSGLKELGLNDDVEFGP